MRIAEDFVETFLFADAALLPAAIGRSDVSATGIDPDIAGFDALGGFHGFGEIVGDDGGGQPVFHAVDSIEHVLVVVPRHHRHHRAENFFAADAHRRRDMVEDGRRDEQSGGKRWIGRPAAARAQLRAFGFGGFDKAHDAIELASRHDRPDVVLLEPGHADW